MKRSPSVKLKEYISQGKTSGPHREEVTEKKDLGAVKSRVAAVVRRDQGTFEEPLAFPASLKPHIQTAPDDFHYISLAVLCQCLGTLLPSPRPPITEQSV